MGSRSNRASLRGPGTALRAQLAEEAARLIVENGIEDFGLAKRKAAARLGVAGAGALPSNAQIHASVSERQRIFEPAMHDRRLVKLRRLAAEVMELLEPFRPRLVGAVLLGTATINSSIELHVFADAPESVAAMLERDGIALRDCQRRFRFGGQRGGQFPGFAFARQGERVEVITFPERGAHEPPLSPVDRRPMRRAGLAAVLALLPA
jgi:hypothetical protein